VNRVSPTSVIAASVAFAGALFLALPRPVDVGRWALGAVLGVGVSFIGFQAATRARGPLPSRSVARRLTLGSGATAAGATLGGALLGVLTILARHQPALRARFAGRLHEPAWRPWALAFESSILEEMLFRLLTMSVVALLVLQLLRKRDPGGRPFVVGLLVSTVLFGLAHVPAWASTTPATLPLVSAVIMLNGIGGLLLGWVFWRLGLAYAICCHFAADVVIQSLGPRILS
jgi:CAAX prenyl protease-like protein